MPQLARWLTFIEQFDYTVVHRTGEKHRNVDSLSRKRQPDLDEEALEAEAENLRVAGTTRRTNAGFS